MSHSQASARADAATRRHVNVTCPFCAILCDDLIIENRAGQLKITAGSCPRAQAGFERVDPAPADVHPLAGGKAVSMEQAIAHAAKIIGLAKHPLIGGLAVDVDGMRAALALADKTGAIVDHMLADGMMRNMLTLQSKGWIVTTLSEVRNRADLLIFANLDAVTDHPRFFERNVWNTESQFGLDTSKREIVYLGDGLNTEPGISPDGRKPLHIKNDPARLNELVNVVRAKLRGLPIAATEVAGVPMAQVDKLIKKIHAAQYGVIVWAPPRLPFASADLIVESLCELVKFLNKDKRFQGIPLGGNESAITANAVCGWQAGYPVRADFSRGYPDYHPTKFSTAKLIANKDVDAVLWVTAFNTSSPPPKSDLPTIWLAPPASGSAAGTNYIPVATPGMDHRGMMVRLDNVVSLPLHKLRDSPLPNTAQVLQQITQKIK